MANNTDPILWKSPRDGIYSVRFYFRGKRRFRSTGTKDRRRAEAILREFAKRLEASSASPPASRVPSLAAFEPEVLRYAATNYKPKTVEMLKLFFGHARRILGSEIPLDELSRPEAVEEFKRVRLAEGVKPSTVNNGLRALSIVLSRAVDFGHLPSRPKIRKLKLEQRPPRFLSREEVGKWLKTASPTLQRFSMLALLTGMRRGEIYRLRWRDVDAAQGTLTVNESKSGRFRVVSLHEDLAAFLTPLRGEPDGFVMGREYKGLQRSFHRTAGSLGFEGVSMHTLRHTFASHYVMAGGELTALKEILGHRDITTTMIYAHLAQDFKRREINKLAPVSVFLPESVSKLSAEKEVDTVAYSLSEKRRKVASGL
jgi:integrase